MNHNDPQDYQHYDNLYVSSRGRPRPYGLGLAGSTDRHPTSGRRKKLGGSMRNAATSLPQVTRANKNVIE